MEEEKQPHSSYNNPDPFTLFMFGNKRRSRGEAEEEEHSFSRKEDWLFGSNNRKRNREENISEFPALNNLLNQIDMEELFKNIDTMMDTASQFKPLWKQISPFIQKWKKS